MEWRVERYDVVGSTMDVAARRAAAGCPAGLVVVAELQTAGRGTHGRSWQAPYGMCLLATALLRPPLAVIQSPRLSRDIAAAVAAAVRDVTGLAARVEEPNDVMVGQRKLAGVLCQSSIRGDRVEYLLIGIGLNVNLAAAELPLPTATSLLVETGRPWDRDVLLRAILGQIERLPGLIPA